MDKCLLTIAAFIGLTIQSFAQSPGGVNSPELWFRTFPSSYNPQGTYYWKDLSGDSYRNRLVDTHGVLNGTEFTLSRNSFITLNFNPTLNLFTQNTPKEVLLRYSNLAQATILGVFMPRPDNIGVDAMLYTIDGRPGEGNLMTKDKSLRTGDTEIDYGKESGEDLLYSSQDTKNEQTFLTTSPRILSYLKADQPLHNVWGEATKAIIGTGYIHDYRDETFSIPLSTQAFDGYIPELIAYGRMLSPLERKKVESYLALKYGLTLEGAYFDSKGNLIWDKDASAAFHHRVTGIARSDTSLLMQPLSTTSYEESPNYTNNPANDTYYNNNTLNLPTNKRLLVMGREEASPMQDGDFMLWGDNDAPTTTYAYEADTLWHVMHRTWELHTNIDSLANDNPIWTGKDLIINKNTDNRFLTHLYQTYPSLNSYAVTKASDEDNSVIEFTMPSSYPTFDVGFHVATDGNCKYGYRFSAGKISPINNGTVIDNNTQNVAPGSRIEVIRRKDYVSLRISGVGNENMLLATNANKLPYGVIIVKSTDDLLTLTDLRQGGFGDTGNQIEFSYNLAKDRNFTQYGKERTFLLIDRSGTGIMTPETTEVIPATGYDEIRGKVLFRNVFFDTDKSGSDRFTFAYYKGMLADLTPSPATCIAGNPQADGKLDVHIKEGPSTYSYTLTIDTVAGAKRGTVAKEGIANSSDFEISGLLPGTYFLHLNQVGGVNLSAKVSDGGNAYAYSTTPHTNLELTWTVADTTSYYHMGIGFIRNNIPQLTYSFYVYHKKLYIIHIRMLLSTDITLSSDDILTVKYTDSGIEFIHNGKIIRTFPHPLRLPFVPIAQFNEGTTNIGNISINGEAPMFDNYTPEVTVSSSSQKEIRRLIMIGSECDSSLPNGVAMEPNRFEAKPQPPITLDKITTENTQFKVIKKPGVGQFDAILTLSKAAQATLLVFDASGKLLVEQTMIGTLTKTASFTAPANGVYIVKAITEHEEFTQKILAQ